MAFPGTCKNCITVGTAQSWAADSAAAAGHAMAQCRAQDCPHDLHVAHEDDKEPRGQCGDSRSLSPFRLAPCCPGRFAAEACMPEAVDPLSSTGGAVDEDGPRPEPRLAAAVERHHALLVGPRTAEPSRHQLTLYV